MDLIYLFYPAECKGELYSILSHGVGKKHSSICPQTVIHEHRVRLSTAQWSSNGQGDCQIGPWLPVGYQFVGTKKHVGEFPVLQRKSKVADIYGMFPDLF